MSRRIWNSLRWTRGGKTWQSWTQALQDRIARLYRRFQSNFWRQIARSRKRPTVQLAVEGLEVRLVPSPWLVTDPGNSDSTSGTLPWAVAQANADTSPAVITFNFATATTITLANSPTLSNTFRAHHDRWQRHWANYHQRWWASSSSYDRLRRFRHHREFDHYGWLRHFWRRHCQWWQYHCQRLSYQQQRIYSLWRRDL